MAGVAMRGCRRRRVSKWPPAENLATCDREVTVDVACPWVRLAWRDLTSPHQELSADLVGVALEKLLSSNTLQSSPRLRRFLEHVVRHSLAGRRRSAEGIHARCRSLRPRHPLRST